MQEQRKHVSIASKIRSTIPRKKVCRALSNTLLELESLGLKATSLDNSTSNVALAQLILVLRRISRGISPGRARPVNLLEVTPSTEECLEPVLARKD